MGGRALLFSFLLGAAFLLHGADARTAEATLALLLVTGAVAGGALLVATYRERVVLGRRVRRLRDPDRRAEALEELRRRVEVARRVGDAARLEDALREAVEALLVAGLWDEVGELLDEAGPLDAPHLRPPFRTWLAGVGALAALHQGDPARAEDLLEKADARSGQRSWLAAVDALRLALAGEGEEALARLEQVEARVGPAARHLAALAELHALAGTGHREEVRARLHARGPADPLFQGVLELEGPASPLARALQREGAGPFRAAG